MKTYKRIFLIFIFLLSLCSASGFAADISPEEIYEAPGFHPDRETLSSIPNEHIDPFTGGLTLTFEDIRLPGNGGLDLVIRRTFNSKNTCNEWTEWLGTWSCTMDDENTWLGYGWTLHFGRLFRSTNVNITHVVEIPDGSRHAAYNLSGSVSITKDYWLLNTNVSPFILTLANGTKIYYGQEGPPHPDFPTHIAHYATKIQDVNGNEINIYYKTSGSSEISYVIDSIGRRIDFTTSTVNYATRLVSISGPGVSISYTHQSTPTHGRTFLIEAKPPIGNPWRYGYNGLTFDLTQVTTPAGGVITYSYNSSMIDRGAGYLPYYIFGQLFKRRAAVQFRQGHGL